MKKRRKLKKVPKILLSVIMLVLAIYLMFIAIAGGIYLSAVQCDRKYSVVDVHE